MDTEKPTIEFYLDQRSGVSPYLQLVQQVKHALRLGFLKEGDQLPTMRMVVSRLAINPNTVFKAYRELEYEGLIESRPGQGTFVRKTLADASLASHAALRSSLIKWLQEAEAAGLDEESIEALFASTFQQFHKREEIA
ncbi:MAG TPA: GntR family transcriptional regulator [Ktedonobacteraceae bacterium]|nr:GntR family transcriptional regulator [Ktedonobacteraceae bacterium]